MNSEKVTCGIEDGLPFHYVGDEDTVEFIEWLSLIDDLVELVKSRYPELSNQQAEQLCRRLISDRFPECFGEVGHFYYLKTVSEPQ